MGPMKMMELCASGRLSVCIGCSDVIVICGHISISMLCGNTAYCVKLNGEDLSRYSNKNESVVLRKCPFYHYHTALFDFLISTNRQL